MTTWSWSSSLSYSHLPEKSHAILDQTFKMRFLMLESAKEKKHFRPGRVIVTHLCFSTVHILCGFDASILAANE